MTHFIEILSDFFNLVFGNREQVFRKHELRRMAKAAALRAERARAVRRRA